uniref:Uncharacterized protein n=1 Tax=Hucho hucho TaxID=62062 RepID=A0A4W5KMB2_9TELE
MKFEDDIVDICLKLLVMCQRPCGRLLCNPIYVSRVVSAMISANNDRGVLMGRWDGQYVGGIFPTHWNGSVEVLRRWLKYGSHPVKYGQCWGFAGVMCTGRPSLSLNPLDIAAGSRGAEGAAAPPEKSPAKHLSNI